MIDVDHENDISIVGMAGRFPGPIISLSFGKILSTDKIA